MSTPSQDSFFRKLDRLRKSTAQDNQLTTLSRYINTGFPCEKKNLPIDLQDYWNYQGTLSIKLNTTGMTTIQHLMSEHCYDSISNKSTWPEENTTQKKYLTRLLDHNNIDLPCDKESSPTDLPESWSHKELLYNRPKLINQEQIIPMTHKEVYLLSRPLKTMAHQCRHTEKEVHLLLGPSAHHPVMNYTIPTHLTHKEFCFLPGPSELQPVITQYTPREKAQDLPPTTRRRTPTTAWCLRSSEIQRLNTDPESNNWIQPFDRKPES